MKKKWSVKDFSYLFSWVRKIVKIMRLSIFLIVLTSFQTLAITNFAQSKKMNIKIERATLDEVLQLIERESGYFLFYNNKVVDLNEEVSVDVKNKTISEILDELFEDKDVEYTFSDKQIILSKKGDSSVYERSTQQKAVSGIVTDENGEPLPGVTVLVKGTTNGTVTDVNGIYSLSGISAETVLQFSFVGMRMQEIVVNNQSTIDIVLVAETIGIEEVIAIGYGEIKKSDLTGAVAVIDAEELANVPVSRIDQALQGRASGVLVTTPTGDPTAAPVIQIRGTNSLTGDNRPLFVIDGFIAGQGFDLNTINPNDVESFQVLKSATAISIYGTRGANGVIIINTKTGSQLRKPEFTVNFYTGVSNMTRKLPIISGSDQAEFANDVALSSGVTDVPYPDPGVVPNTDWQDMISRTGTVNNIEMSFGGNNGNLNYFISTNYFNQQAIIKKSGIQRVQTRFNFDYKVSEKMKLGLRANIGYTETDKSMVNFRTATELPSLVPAYLEDGSINYFNDATSAQFANPVGLFKYDTNESRRLNLLANFYLQVEPIEGLVIKSTIGPNIRTTKNNRFNSLQIPTRQFADANVNQNLGTNILQENTITYTKEFGKHAIRLLGAASWQVEELESLDIDGNQIPIDANGFNNVFLAENFDGSNTGFSKRSLVSYFGRVEYGFNDKYLLTFVGRVDGSSVFAPGNKYAFFPSVSAAWNMHEETFIQDLGLFHSLKLRADFGSSGSQGISSLRTLPTFSSGLVVINDEFVSGLTVGRPENPDLSWETTQQLDLGLEASFFNGNLDFELGYYKKRTKDLLLEVAVPSFTGSTQRLENLGSIENSGMELNVGATIMSKNDFRWTSSMSISGNRSKVIDIGDREEILKSRGFNGNALAVIKPGLPIGAFYGYESLGVWKNQEEVDAAIADQANDVSLEDQELNGAPGTNDYVFVDGATKPGDIKLADTNGDGKLNKDDYRQIGDPTPKFYGGINNSFTYKNWSLDLYLQGTFGNDIYFLRETSLILGDERQAKLPEILDRWTPENQDTDIPGAGRNDVYHNKPQSRYIKDGSHLRIKTVKLGYKLPPIKGVKDISLYVLVDNLHVFSNYIGYDPEVTQLTDGNANTLRGFDETAYPKSRTFTFGVNVKF